MADAVPQSEEVSAALGRLLEWPEIARSPQLAGFLKYIVQRTLDGEAASIKAYAIAVDVLGRPQGFDPQTDPIVRVQARRLRALLDQYYAQSGREERIRISLPVGRYVPEFAVHDPVSDAARSESEASPLSPRLARYHPRRSPWIWLSGLLGIALVIALVGFFLPRLGASDPFGETASRPSIVIKDFENLTGNPATVALSAGLALELVTDLEQFETLTVSYGGTTQSPGVEDRTPDFVLNGIVRLEGGAPQYSVILSDPTQNDVVWTRIIALDPAAADQPDILDRVSAILSRELGSFRGPLHANARSLMRGERSLAGIETLYRCRMAFDYYRDTSAVAAGRRAQACFAALGAEGSSNGMTLAAQASLLAELSEDAGADTTLREPLSLVEKALAATPTNSFVWEQRARLEERLGRHDAAEAAYNSALQLNPANLDAVAARARHLAFLGRVAEGASLANIAITGAPAAPPWYFAAPLLERYDARDWKTALDYAEIYARADPEIGPVLVVMTAQSAQQADILSRYLPQVMDTRSFHRLGIMAQLRRRIADPARVSALRQSLLEAGVPMQALYSAY